MALRRGLLGRADHRHRPHVAEERVERIEPFLERALHVIDRVEHAGVAFDQPPPHHLAPLPGSQTRDLSLRSTSVHMVSSDSSLVRAEQLADVLGVAQRIARTLRRARDRAGFDARAFHPYEHLGRGAHQLLVAELQEELVRTRAGVLHSLEQLRSPAGVGRAERLPQHDLVVVAAAHALADRFDLGHVLFGQVVGIDRPRLRLRRRRDFGGFARKAAGRFAVALEIVLVTVDLLALAIHEEDVVAEEQVQVLVTAARERLFDRLELEQQVVAERAHQREVRIADAAELLR